MARAPPRGARSRRGGTQLALFAKFTLAVFLAILPTGESARFVGSIKEPSSWEFMAKFCFLPADKGGYVNQVHGMVSTKIKFHIQSQFSILHYITATGSEKKETGDSIANWESVYNSKSTCLERIRNQFAFPFYLAELARAAVPAPPPPPGPPGARRLLHTEGDGDEETRSFGYVGNSTYKNSKAGGFDAHTDAFYETSLRDAPYVQVPLRYLDSDNVMNGDAYDGKPGRRGLLQGPHGTYDAATNKTTYVINGQTVLVDGNQAGSNTAWGLGLIDITQTNAVDAYTNLPLDNSAKLRIYGDGWVEVLRTTFYVGDRARFFYVAGANCDRLCETSTCNGDLDIEYEIEFTNGFEWYSKHFGADEIGVLETAIAFSCLYVVLGGFYFAVRKELKRVRKHHHTVKMLGSSIILAFFAHGFFFLHYIWYSSDGIGYLPLRFIGRLLQLSSETTFLILLILLGKGWTICCRKISARGRVKIAVFGTVYATAWLLTVGYHEFVADKASTLHMYQSGFGNFLCALRFVGLGWFWYSISVSVKKYASKTGFYKKFALTFALWFYGLPVIVIVAQTLPPYQRFVIVNAMEFTFLFTFQLTLLLMYVPHKQFNKSFPFHATTNETFLHAANSSNRTHTVRAVVAQQVAVGQGRHPPQKPGSISDWDKKELLRAMQSARVLQREAKTIADCLAQIETNNERESDDEAYESVRGGDVGGRTVGSPSAGFGNNNNGGNRRASEPNAGGHTNTPRSPVSGREYGDGAYRTGRHGFGQSETANGFGEDRRLGSNSPGPSQFSQPGGAEPTGFGQSNAGFGDEERGGVGAGMGDANGAPMNQSPQMGSFRNPLFANANANNAPPGGGFNPAPPTSPMGGGAGSAFGDVANQRSLLARLGKTRGNRPLGSGGYT